MQAWSVHRAERSITHWADVIVCLQAMDAISALHLHSVTVPPPTAPARAPQRPKLIPTSRIIVKPIVWKLFKQPMIYATTLPNDSYTSTNTYGNGQSPCGYIWDHQVKEEQQVPPLPMPVCEWGLWHRLAWRPLHPKSDLEYCYDSAIIVMLVNWNYPDLVLLKPNIYICAWYVNLPLDEYKSASGCV